MKNTLIIAVLKGLSIEFGGGGGSTDPSPAHEYGLLQAISFITITVAATVDFMVSRIGRYC